jgi:hypothetical protein
VPYGNGAPALPRKDEYVQGDEVQRDDEHGGTPADNKLAMGISVGLALGTCIGIVLGLTVFDDLGAGLTLGMALGTAVGVAIGAGGTRSEGKEDGPGEAE